MRDPNAHRTLMLEPQWHPIRWVRKKRPDQLFPIIVPWAIFGPILAAAFYPERMAVWSSGRWVAFGIACLPWLIAVVALLYIVVYGTIKGLLWCHRHPPVKIKTRYVSNDRPTDK